VGEWLARREALWAALEHRPCVPLPIGERSFDAGDVEAINAELAPRGLVYGAGLLASDRPTYFLADCHGVQRRDPGLTVLVCGHEHARCLFAPPAALVASHTIVIRRESLARILWEKFEAFGLRRADGPMRWLLEAACPSSGARGDEPRFAAVLPRLLDEISEALVLHEIGEFQAGEWLGPGWSALRLALGQRRTDLYVRALRDHLADLEVTLPALLEGGQIAALHFWFANYDGVREQLFPGLVRAYAAWREGDAGQGLRQAARAGAVHFRALAGQVMDLHERLGQDAAPAIHRLLTGPQAVFDAARR
jgi:hypothetical protein